MRKFLLFFGLIITILMLIGCPNPSNPNDPIDIEEEPIENIEDPLVIQNVWYIIKPASYTEFPTIPVSEENSSLYEFMAVKIVDINTEDDIWDMTVYDYNQYTGAYEEWSNQYEVTIIEANNGVYKQRWHAEEFETVYVEMTFIDFNNMYFDVYGDYELTDFFATYENATTNPSILSDILSELNI